VSYQFKQFILGGKIDNLSREVLEEVFKRMDFENIKNCEKVCRRWRAIIRNRTSRARREHESLVEGFAYLSLYDMEELKRRRLGLKVWAQKWGYLHPKEVAETYLKYTE